MFNPAFPTQAVHMVLAAFAAVGFAVAGVHAAMLRRPHRDARAVAFHRRAIALSLAVGGIAAALQPVSGDFAARQVAENQPVKLAAMEAHWETETRAPLRLGGWPDEEREETSLSIELPALLSLLAFHDPDAEVKGLKAFPRDERPPVAITHVSFQIMVGAGTLMIAVAAGVGLLAWRRGGFPDDPRVLTVILAASPLGLIALEAGWFVTEVGRQPWVIRGVMRTADAVTPMPGLVVPMTAITLLYALLGVVVIGLLRRIVFDGPRVDEVNDAA